jgi:hypothetical protein
VDLRNTLEHREISSANSGVFVFPYGEDLRGLPGVIPWHYQRKRPARRKEQGMAKRAQGNGRRHLTCTKRHDHTNPALIVLDRTLLYEVPRTLCLSAAVMTLSHRDLKIARFPHISVHWLHC